MDYIAIESAALSVMRQQFRASGNVDIDVLQRVISQAIAAAIKEYDKQKD